MTREILEQVNEVAIDQEYTQYLLTASAYAINQFQFEELMDKANDMTLEEFDDYCYNHYR